MLQLDSIDRRWRRKFQARLEEMGLLQGEGWRPLLLIARHDARLYQRDLSGALDIEAHTMGSLLDRLAAAGLIARSYDRHDRRAKVVEITPAGRGLAERIEAELVEFWREMLPDLSTAEIEACVQVLDRVEAALGEEGAALSLKRRTEDIR